MEHLLEQDAEGYVKPFRFLNPSILDGRAKFVRRMQRTRSLPIAEHLAVVEVEIFKPDTVMLVDGSTFLIKAVDALGVLPITHTVKVMNKIELHFTRMTVGEAIVYAKWSELQQ